jgi:ribosomal protein L32
MTTRTSSLTSLSRAGTRRADKPLVWSRAKITFVSTCPKCGHERPQHGYTRRVLVSLLHKRPRSMLTASTAMSVGRSAKANDARK